MVTSHRTTTTTTTYSLGINKDDGWHCLQFLNILAFSHPTIPTRQAWWARLKLFSYQCQTPSKAIKSMRSKSWRPRQSFTMLQIRLEYVHLNNKWHAVSFSRSQSEQRLPFGEPFSLTDPSSKPDFEWSMRIVCTSGETNSSKLKNPLMRVCIQKIARGSPISKSRHKGGDLPMNWVLNIINKV
jgi:hypothetical protein